MIQYGGRPHIPASCVLLPTLCGSAHCIIPTRGSRGALFLGPEQAAVGAGTLDQLRASGVSAILNCSRNIPNAHAAAGVLYARVALSDSMGANLLEWMRPAVQWIECNLAEGRSVLVHCQMGVSRSASIVIAHQMLVGGMTRDDAYAAVKTIRQCIDPNAGFWAQLAELGEAGAELLEMHSDATAGGDASAASAAAASWARRSRIEFEMCGAVATPAAGECSSDVVAAAVLSNLFSRGRGFAAKDVAWARAAIAGTSSSSAAKTLLVAGSSFLEDWCGEYRDSDVAALRAALG